MTSPLATTNPASISELFKKDPLTLSDFEVDEIVSYYRKRRKEWSIKDAEKQNKPRATKAPKKVFTGQLSLDDLDI